LAEALFAAAPDCSALPLSSQDKPERKSMQDAAASAARRSAVRPAGMAWEAFVLKLVDLFPDPTDRQVIELMAEGERAMARYAQALGCVHLDAEAQPAAGGAGQRAHPPATEALRDTPPCVNCTMESPLIIGRVVVPASYGAVLDRRSP